MLCEFDVPTATFPKDALPGTAVPAAEAPEPDVVPVPAPLKEMRLVSVAPVGELLVNSTYPLEFPLSLGLNCTVTHVPAPGRISCGSLIPPKLNSDPLTVSLEIAIAILPVLLIST
jgi:hypothetical protein